jgi:hypothetical protein
MASFGPGWLLPLLTDELRGTRTTPSPSSKRVLSVSGTDELEVENEATDEVERSDDDVRETALVGTTLVVEPETDRTEVSTTEPRREPLPRGGSEGARLGTLVLGRRFEASLLRREASLARRAEASEARTMGGRTSGAGTPGKWTCGAPWAT